MLWDGFNDYNGSELIIWVHFDIENHSCMLLHQQNTKHAVIFMKMAQ